MVKGFGARPCWGFPKGKINKDEAEIACAVREVRIYFFLLVFICTTIPSWLNLKVFEEVGYDMASKVNENDCIESVAKERRVKLYIVSGVPEDTSFETHTRGEISVSDIIQQRCLSSF